jgi:hypothetical protein
MFREIIPVTIEKFSEVGLDVVDLAFDFEGFLGFETSEAEVAVEAPADSLEEFLVGFPCGGEDVLVVMGVAANEAVVGDIFVERAWVDIGSGHSWGGPDLTGNVTGFSGPVSCGHHGLFAVEEDEALGDVGVFVVGLVGSGSSKDANPDTGLRPVSFGALVSRIVGCEAEVDFVAGGGDDVFDRDPIFEGAQEFDFGAIFGC